MKRTVLAFAGLACSLLGQGDTSAVVVGAGYKLPTPVIVAPGQVITFFVHGIGAGLTNPAAANSLPLPTSLAGISATFLQGDTIPVPILAVEPVSAVCDQVQPGCGSTYTAVTLQIPFRIGADDPTVLALGLGAPGMVSFAENGVVMASVYAKPMVDQIHILRITGSALNLAPGDTVPTYGFPAVTHANGSRVSEGNPAKSGEEVAIYAVGLGYTSFGTAGDAPAAPVPTLVPFRISFDPRPNALGSRPSHAGENGPGTAAPDFAGLIPGYAGLYQINVTVPALPAGAESCDPTPTGRRIESNMTINIFGHASFDGVGICVQPGP